MEFRTQIKIGEPLFGFTHRDSILLMGSCFAENIGRKLQSCFFEVDINPFGTLYNPLSVAESLRMLIENKPASISDLFASEGLFHSFSYHSRFSAPTAEATLQQINERMTLSAATLKKANRLVVTFGTAWVYRLKQDGRVVANCHKLPENTFVRTRLGVDEIVGRWSELLNELRLLNPALRILFTVSPVRHWKDGANGNQLSKATLLLAVDELRRLFPDSVAYFPAYEIVMDELRDYRFYADDMLHPSDLAVDYIFECFAGHFFSPDTQGWMKELLNLHKALNHKPFNPESEPYRLFLLQTLRKTRLFCRRISSTQLDTAVCLLEKQIKDTKWIH